MKKELLENGSIIDQKILGLGHTESVLSKKNNSRYSSDSSPSTPKGRTER
jgi:hypothetical protein